MRLLEISFGLLSFVPICCPIQSRKKQNDEVASRNRYPQQILDFLNFTIVISHNTHVFGISKSNDTATQENSPETIYLKGYSLRTPEPTRTPTVQRPQETSTDQRSKRGVVHLYNMITCVTGCDPFMYKGYGCYCGFMGSGRSVDGIDNCCKMHDNCYDRAECPMYLEYVVPYFWKCYYARPLCALDHYEFGGPGSCASRLCECDQAFAKCIRKYPCPKRRKFCRSSPIRYLQNIIMAIT